MSHRLFDRANSRKTTGNRQQQKTRIVPKKSNTKENETQNFQRTDDIDLLDVAIDFTTDTSSLRATIGRGLEKSVSVFTRIVCGVYPSNVD